MEMTKEELQTILDDHKLWLDSEGDEGERAYLRSADLHGANLRYADLYEADLRGTNLSGTNLSGADLRRADLKGADLSGAIFADGWIIEKKEQNNENN